MTALLFTYDVSIDDRVKKFLTDNEVLSHRNKGMFFVLTKRTLKDFEHVLKGYLSLCGLSNVDSLVFDFTEINQDTVSSDLELMQRTLHPLSRKVH